MLALDGSRRVLSNFASKVMRLLHQNVVLWRPSPVLLVEMRIVESRCSGSDPIFTSHGWDAVTSARRVKPFKISGKLRNFRVSRGMRRAAELAVKAPFDQPTEGKSITVSAIRTIPFDSTAAG